MFTGVYPNPKSSVRIGKINVAAALAIPLEDLIRNHIYVNECCARVSEQRVVIMDMEGLSMSHLSPAGLDVLKQFIGIDQRCSCTIPSYQTVASVATRSFSHLRHCIVGGIIPNRCMRSTL
jgi:hypothetical protein